MLAKYISATPWIDYLCFLRFSDQFFSPHNNMLIAWLGLGIKNPLGYDEENITFGLRYLLWSPQTWLEKSEVLIKTYYVVAKKRKKKKHPAATDCLTSCPNKNILSRQTRVEVVPE